LWLWRTALREAEEELGVPRTAVQPLGYLDSVPVTRSGFLVTPLVGLLGQPFTPRIQESEVDAYFWFPLRDRLQRVRVERRPVPHHPGVEMPGYSFEDHFVWG
ncbi:NUDIX hydrolase, partial [mine drainage metagenome]